MVKDNLEEDIRNLLEGKKTENPGYQNPEVARAIAGQMMVQDRPNDKIIELEDGSRAIVKQQVEKLIFSYFGMKDLAKQILEIQPMYYDKAKNWWLWNMTLKSWELTDETDILNIVSTISTANTIKSKEKTEIIEALKQHARLNKPQDIKGTWIQFKDIIYDIKTGETTKSTPKYFSTNPIPYKLNEDKIEATPTMDRIFEEWVGKEHVQLLYEILSYCLLPDYPIHRLFCLIGPGMNGKGCFLRLLEKFIGGSNVTSTELDVLLNSRFEVTRLHKKLVCIMGETNFAELSKTSILKKLTGQDLIGFEYKNKTPFSEMNYAKIIIATNNLPETTDKTIGFYRRWTIIDFPNQFSEEKDILLDIPEGEYECLALKCCSILHDLLHSRKFTLEGSIEERAKKFEEKSDPISKFIREEVEEDGISNINKSEFEVRLNQWCKSNRFREISETSINKKMKELGINDSRIRKTWLETGVFVEKQVRVWLNIKWRYGDA